MSTRLSKPRRETRSNGRASVCSFTFADGRHCRMLRSGRHPYLCAYHARKEAQALAGEQIGRDLALYLSGHYISANDLTAALGRLFVAVAQDQLKPRTASTLAYLGQTLVQTIPLAQHEFINAFSTDTWRRAIRSSYAPPQSDPAPAPQPLPAQTPAPQISQGQT